MNRKQWQRVNQIVDTVLELDEPERSTYIEEHCGKDEQLRYRVTELLEAIEKSNSEGFLEETGAYLEHLATDLSREEGETFTSSLISETIGHYKITELIGHGGMGSVFLAKRADKAYEGEVAVKVLRRGMDTPSNIARFERERNILAGLDHPNIARLLDGGVTGDELPYLVMEYVDGIPLYEYCNKHQLSIDERLNLFSSICKAVQHAHRNAVIHRDLKPSNILVTDDGTVKILDFGIAKLLEPEDPETTLFQTRTGARILTLGYATPEQVESKPITTATDIYTLGMLLHELLAGVHPFDLDDKNLAEIEKLIREQSSDRPSVKFRQLSQNQQKKIAQKRGISVSAMTKKLEGDLDAILMKALRKEPQARYSSTDELIKDLQRRGQNQPVLARKGTARYKTKKYIKRHKAGLAVAAGFLLLIIGFGFIYTWQISRERDRAQLEAEKAQKVSTFLTELFQAGDPDLNPNETITASMMLDRGEQQINQLKDQPQVQAQLASVMGTAYRNLGKYEKAKPLLEQNRRLIKNSTGEFSLEYADALHSLGYLAHDMHNFPRALSLHRRELAIRRSAPNSKPLKIAETLNRIGVMLYHEDKDRSADSAYKEALELIEETDASHPEIETDIIKNRSNALRQLGNLDLAKELGQQALAARKKNLGEIHPKVAGSYNNVALTLKELDKWEKAASLYQSSLQIVNQIYEVPHPKIEQILGYIGILYQDQERYKKAVSYLSKALEMEQKIYEKNHPTIAHTLSHLTTIFRKIGKLDKAEKYMRQVLAIRLENYGEIDDYVSTAYNDLAIILKQQGQIKAADSLYHKSMEISKQLQNGPSGDIALALENLGVMYQEEKRYKKAEDYHIQALDMYKELREIPDSDISEQIHDLAQIYNETASADKVLSLLKKALAFDEKSFEENSITLAHIKISFGSALLHVKNYADAEQQLTEGYQLLKEQNASQTHTEKAQNYLSKLYEAWGKPDLAKKYEP